MFLKLASVWGYMHPPSSDLDVLDIFLKFKLVSFLGNFTCQVLVLANWKTNEVGDEITSTVTCCKLNLAIYLSENSLLCILCPLSLWV